MIDRLVDILTASPEPPDAIELADVLWLADHMPPHRTGSPPAAAGSGPLSADVLDHDEMAPRPEPVLMAGVHLRDPVTYTAEPAAQDPTAARWSGTLAGIPAIAAIPGAARIVRALRPLRTRVAGLTSSVIDEAATVANIADTGLWLPELRPDPARWLDLVLIVDDSASMQVWQRTIAEFRELLTQLGAFRAIRTVVVDADSGDVIPALGGQASRRLVLILTDCVGSAWAAGSLLRSAEPLQRTGPVAIVQMLPQRLWAGCGLPFTPVWLDRDPSGTGSIRARKREADPEAAGGDAGSAIPVLELDPLWLGPWAEMLARKASAPIAGMAVYTQSEAAPVPRPERLTGYERVALFRSVASPTALRLAMYLAAAPLSLPVMRLVQHVMLPRSGPADLAEVFLSGLLRRVASPGPATMEFDFQPSVREMLLSGLRRAEAIRVYRLVSAYVDERLGSPPEFPAVFGASWPEPAAAESWTGGPLTDPFGAVALTVLRSVGGQYSEIADKMTAAREDPGKPSPPERGPQIADTTTTGGPAVSEPTTVKQPSLWRGVPPRNPNFTGRQDLLLAMRSQLSQVGITALVPIALRGLGGVGKTQAAIEYAHRFAADYDLIGWIAGEASTQLRNELAALAPDLGVPRADDVEVTLRAVRDALNRGVPYTRWLLVVDNADDPDTLMRYLPQAGGQILITSRNQRWGEFATTYQVGEFTREESIALIRLRGKDISEQDADRLADRLGDLPIAVEQAAAWQAETGMTVSRYLALLDNQMSAILAENPPEGYNVTIVAAWTLAFEDLQGQSPEGAALVQLCAFLGPDPIPYALLWEFRHAAGLPQELQNMLGDEFGFHRAVRQAGQRALLKVDAGRQTLTEHRLVQAVMRERLSPPQRAEMTRLVWQMLIAANPGRPDDPRNWEMLAIINRHISPTRLIDYDSRSARAVIIDQIRYLFNRGDLASSRELGEEAVWRWRESPGPSDEQTLIACRLLGIARRELGMTREALEINEDTLNRIRVAFGEEHEHTLITANSYACDLRIAGSYTAALELDQKLYNQHKVVFGENEEATLRSAHNLAVDMRLNGRYREAHDLDRENLRRRRDVLGDDRWETWSSAGALGRDLRGLGQFAESARILQDAIVRCGELLGPDHPEVVRMRMDHASSLRRLGQLDEAVRVAEACVDVNLRRLGERHNYTLSAMTTLADVLRLTGNVQRSAEIAERVVAAAPATYGEQHPLVLTCEHNYAIALRADGATHQAYELDRRVNQRFVDLLGEHKRRTLNSYLSLARDLELADDLARAENLLRHAMDMSVEVRGAGHVRTLFFAANLARLLRARGEEAEADEIRDRTFPVLADILGSGHPELVLAERGEFIEMETEIPDR